MYALFVRFSQPAGVPTLKESVREPVAGLLIVVPKGCVFHVTVASAHVAVTRNTSIVRHAAGSAVEKSRIVATRTVALAGMAGWHCARSNRA